MLNRWTSAFVTAVLRTELGAPIEDLFRTFDETPVAATSIGQVHAGRLQDGTEVAVKVQYPGVANAIEADLANTDLLAGRPPVITLA